MLTLLMTRPRDAAERFVARFAPDVRDRLRVIYSPLMQIEFLPDAVSPEGFHGVIFTSANGVAAAQAAGLRPTLPAYCVGPATAAAAQRARWSVEETCENADALVAALIARRPPAPLLHLRGVHARGEIAERLTSAGIETRDRPVYDQHLIGLSDAARQALAGPDPVIVPLFSPRSARHFADICEGSAPLWLIAISAAAAEPVENMGDSLLILAERPDGAAMAASVERLVEGREPG